MESEKVPSPLASPRTLLPALPLAQPLASSSAMPQPIDLLVDIIKRQPSVRLPDVDGEPLSVNVPIDSVLRELLKQPAIRNWAKIEEYIVTALSSIKNQNESTSTYDGESREYFLKKYIKHRARHRSMMKFLGEDERITIAREKDLSYLTEIGQTGRGGIIDGTNNRIDKTRNTTQTIFGDSESTITQTLSRPEEKKAESDETMVINTNNTDNGNVHAVYAESFKQLEQSVGIINKNDIQSSKNAEKTSRASIKNKTIKPKNIHNPPGPSSAVNSQQLTGLNSKAYGCREVNILLTRINCPTKRIIISSVSNRDKKEKRSADNENCNATSSESPKISGKKVINQNNDEDFQGRGSNLTNNFNTLCTESLDQLRKNYVHVSKGLKDTRLELQEKVPIKRPKSKRLERQIESTALRKISTMKEHNITNSERKRSNNNVTEVLPIKMRKTKAKLQKTAIEGEVRSLTKKLAEQEEINALLAKKLIKVKKAFAKFKNKNKKAEKEIVRGMEKTTGLQKPERTVEGEARSLTEEKKTNARLVEKLRNVDKSLAKLRNENKEAKNKLAVYSKSLEKIIKELPKQSL